MLERGEGRQDACSDAGVPRGTRARCCQQKAFMLFCKSVRDPAPHQDQGHHPELTRELSCLGQENRFLRFSPFYAAVTSSGEPATPPGHKDIRRQETLTLEGCGGGGNHGSSPGKGAQHALCLHCPGKAPKPSPSACQEHGLCYTHTFSPEIQHWTSKTLSRCFLQTKTSPLRGLENAHMSKID